MERGMDLLVLQRSFKDSISREEFKKVLSNKSWKPKFPNSVQKEIVTLKI